MSDRRGRLDWQWEEIVLACDLVYQNGWRQLDEGDPRVRELSGILQQMSIHPLDTRLTNFRNFAGVAQKTRNIATVHPDYIGRPSNGNKLDKKVLEEFLDNPGRMRSIAASLRKLALSDEPENVSQLFSDEDESVMEGRYLLRFHRVRERSPKLRDKKIRSVLAHGGPLICEVCKFNFEKAYGDLGKGFIECHHVEPLHESGERPRTIRDLALLCSNCHHMIHRRPPWPTPSQLRDIIRTQSLGVPGERSVPGAD
jgi:5-methylcytosine-specific restriction protein A